MPKIIQKYIGKEIFIPFLLSLFVFTLVLLMQNALELSDMIITRGVGFSNFFLLILYTLPSLLWLSIPMAFLMATLTGFGRLSTDNEVIAMHSLGIGIRDFLIPVLTLGVLLFALCFAVGAYGVPWGGESLNRLIYRILQQSATAGIQARTFNDRFADLVLYAGQVIPEENRLSKVIIADYRGDFPETVIARTGTIRTSPTTLLNTLRLSNGSIHQYDVQHGRYRLIHFKDYTLSLTSDADSTQHLAAISQKKPEEMTLSELKEGIASGNLVKQRTFQMHYQEKFALPFSCLVFGLFSIPLGIRLRRSGKVIGFSWSLLIVFLYYILLGIGRNFGAEGMIPAHVAAWLPNATFGTLGAYLLYQTSRKIPKEGYGSMLARIKERGLRFLGG